MAGYMMLIYTTGLNNIPTDLSEAAAIDGANVFQRFRYITIPMLMPSFTIVFFLTLSKCFMLLDPNVALTDGNFNTRLLAMQILRTTKDTNPPDYGLAQAQAVIFFLLIAAVTLTQVVVTKRRRLRCNVNENRHVLGEAVRHLILIILALYTLAPLLFLFVNAFKSNNEIMLRR